MRRGGRLAIPGVVVAVACAVVACSDLFHSTSDLKNRCDLDADACDICAADPASALDRAQTACAWLGACETPLGQNRLGACSVNAVLAYDCDANPSRRPRGATRAFWDCMGRAASCGDVQRCAQPGGVQHCIADNFLNCGSGGNATVRTACVAKGDVAHAENCAAWGQTCSGGAAAICSGDPTDGGVDAGADTCGADSCAGTVLKSCAQGKTFQVDCGKIGMACSASVATPDGVRGGCVAGP